DREDAEALCERREDDREAADVARGVRVATDRAGGETAEDPDPDARADHAEGREGSEVFHVACSLRGSGSSPGLGPCGQCAAAASTAWMVDSASPATSCSSPCPSIATSVNIRVRVAKISAWMALRSTSRASIAIGMIARVRAV